MKTIVTRVLSVFRPKVVAGRFGGKYRATVLLNTDPEQRGRVQLIIPDVLGAAPSTWAEACVPLAGSGMGVYLVPPVGANVWVEFEQGEVAHPVWTGCRWVTAADVPFDAKLGLPMSPSIVLQTAGQHGVVISDLPPTPASGGVKLQSAGNAMIVVNDSGIYISNGKGATITLVGPVVTVNGGALTVT